MTHQTLRGRNPIEQNTGYVYVADIPSRLNISSELILWFAPFALNQALVAQKVDNAIHRKNPYLLDAVISFPHTHLLDNDLSGG